MSSEKTRVLFVCLGNICRSPIAEGAFQARVDAQDLSDTFYIDSAGTGGYHVGEGPDPRSVEIAQKHGVDIGQQRSRQLTPGDLDTFDYVVAMDSSNFRNINRLSRHTPKAQVSLMLDETGGVQRDVPDPYYGGRQGFSNVWDMVDAACSKLLERILAERA